MTPLSKIKKVVIVASNYLDITPPVVRLKTRNESELFANSPSPAAANIMKRVIVFARPIGKTSSEIVFAAFAALHELRHIWQKERIDSADDFAEKETWRAEFSGGTMPHCNVEDYNSRSVEVDANAFGVFAVEAFCGIKIAIEDIACSALVAARYEELKRAAKTPKI